MTSIQQASDILHSVRGTPLSRETRLKKTLELATLLIQASKEEITEKEKRREAWLAKLVEDQRGKAFLTAMTDQCFRSQNSKRTADQLIFLLKKFGIPRFLNDADRFKFLIFYHLGNIFPNLFIPFIKRQIKKEMSPVLLPEESAKKRDFFEKCRSSGVRINLNHLGEAILGEAEAKRRLDLYLCDLADPDIEYISVKISTLYSQINLVGWEESLEILSKRLGELYLAAQTHRYTHKDGSTVPKFVNLDMEEYRDLDLTITLFQKVLNEPRFFHLQAGIVLQSYLPDSYKMQKRLTEWAQERVKKGGSPIKLRIVKGANLAMEAIESSLKGWEQAPFETKIETDANFKKMVEYATRPEHAHAVHVGIGSHNLFDIAYTLVLRAESQLEHEISFEMLQGMGESLRRVVHQISGTMLLYCPEAKEESFQNAIAYLVRRLDENTGRENFLRHLFTLHPESASWKEESQRFLEAGHKVVSEESRRKQNRLSWTPQTSDSFHNEPDTDFSLENNRLWVNNIYKMWENKTFSQIPLVIGGKEILNSSVQGIDPSKPQTPLYSVSLANEKEIQTALQVAKEHRWDRAPYEERSRILGQVAEVFRKKRGDLIGAMIADGGKTVWEADPEVSEAIDFIEYYRKEWKENLKNPDIEWQSKGTVLVAPPWNFPCSIPVGGIVAALTTGNSVLFKPAPETALVGWTLIQLFWEGGVPKEVLQFINCPDDPTGTALIKNPLLDTVLLTGGTQTAKTFLKLHPGIDLYAETGGKNAMIVTALSDRDLAIRDLIQSAFSHSGQKCSACSLAILEAEVYDDPNFLRQLKEAAESLTVGSAWNPSSKITPLIHPPEGPLKRGLTQLEEGESWLLEPRCDPNNPRLWSPGIKIGVQKNSFTHQTELFGPVLGVMRAHSLEEAIEFANGTPYGLTSGLHSLDEREQQVWLETIIAGNLYINRSVTGAIVRRQPFGGCKASSFGGGAKAGGPNYLFQLAKASQRSLPKEKEPLPGILVPLITNLNQFKLSEEELNIWKKSAASYAYWISRLKEKIDLSHVLGQRNDFYHVPLEHLTIRTHRPHLDFLRAAAAALISGTWVEISSATPLPCDIGIPVTVESEEAFLKRMRPERIRLLEPPSPQLLHRAAEIGASIHHNPVLATGRLELLHYLREVSLSHDVHRYGS